MKSSLLRRVSAASIAVTAALAMTASPAVAAPDEGPYVFDSAGSGQAVSISVGLPATLADALAPVINSVPGVDLVDNALQINLANVLSELELPLVDAVPGSVLSNADAATVTGSLQGLVESLVGTVRCLDSPLDITIPPGAETPLVSLQLLQAECTTDAAGRLSVASSRIADLEVNLAGALAILPADVSQTVTETVDTVTATVEESILAPLVDQVLTPVQDTLNETLGTNIDLSEAVRVPELIDLPLISIELIESNTQSLTEGSLVRNVSTATLAGVQLLGTVCLPDTTYRAESFATGEPGGNDYLSAIPTIDVEICDTTTLSPILRLLESDGVLSDVLVNLGGGELQPLTELVPGTEDLFAGLEDLLATVGVSTIVQGRETNAVRSDDGREAGVAVDPFRVTVAPLNNLLAGTPLEGLFVELRGLTVASNVAAAPAPAPEPAPEPEPKPEPAPEAPVSLPRTGGGALAAIAGLLAIGGATTLRRRH